MPSHARTDLEYVPATRGVSRANRSLLVIERFGNPVGPGPALARRAMR